MQPGGRILFLSADAAVMARQMAGADQAAPRQAPTPRQADEQRPSGPWDQVARPEQPAEPAKPKPNPWGRNPTGPKGRWS